MRFSEFLQSLPFWPHARPDYYTHGFLDGKAAAFDGRTHLSTDNTQISERAASAAAALPGDVAPDDARIYQIGWIEGYHKESQRIASLAGQ